ncbi:hypothetical protein SAMN05421869_113128 [Nonomuraea jiangxiensis]|uniref:Alpha amylase inhibitor n=1 Tax=Nonomuraea jiangxiensis TaxID=633440 RepID=A0A1G8XZT6_9ACTN|nr:hypothetical protein SAMN05421869_113128 [Nonomuraea jiangxiensis]
MSLTAKGLIGGIATALLLTIGSASVALASPSSTSDGKVCVTEASSSQVLCVPGTPGVTSLVATISSASNGSSYAVRIRPAEGVSVSCLKPGGTVTYPQGFKISGIQVFRTATCVM